jgi:hypothetical protein
MQLIFAAIMLVVAALIWFVFLRPVAILHGTGTVKDKAYKPSTTYWQYQAGIRLGFRTPTPISIAEGYSLTLQLDPAGSIARVGVNLVESAQYEIGTRVKVEYCVRGVAPFWSRIYVLRIGPLEAVGGVQLS